MVRILYWQYRAEFFGFKRDEKTHGTPRTQTGVRPLGSWQAGATEQGKRNIHMKHASINTDKQRVTERREILYENTEHSEQRNRLSRNVKPARPCVVRERVFRNHTAAITIEYYGVCPVEPARAAVPRP